MNTKRRAPQSIYIHAVVAMLLIQLVHKIVREIPGSLKLSGPGWIVTSIFAFLLLVAIILTISRNRLGLVLGVICGAWMIFQPIYVHIISGIPDQNGVWWYPIFPWIQAVLIIYFCCIAWKEFGAELD